MTYFKGLTDDDFFALVRKYNDAYRQGQSLITDDYYDNVVIPELRQRHPEHEYLKHIEPDNQKGVRVKHGSRMFSMEKTYGLERLRNFFSQKAKCPFDSDLLRLTPKLDGCAASFENNRLLTRGDGFYGIDISHLIDHGLEVQPGIGEIVLSNDFIRHETLCDITHQRSFIAGLVRSYKLSDSYKYAIEHKLVKFELFKNLKPINTNADEVLDKIDEYYDLLINGVNYLCDGIVIEFTDPKLIECLGSTEKNKRSQIAYKRYGRIVVSQVISIHEEVGPKGRITPVAHIVPVKIDGILISKVNLHSAKTVESLGIRETSYVTIRLAGHVIPHVTGVVSKPEL